MRSVVDRNVVMRRMTVYCRVERRFIIITSRRNHFYPFVSYGYYTRRLLVTAVLTLAWTALALFQHHDVVSKRISYEVRILLRRPTKVLKSMWRHHVEIILFAPATPVKVGHQLEAFRISGAHSCTEGLCVWPQGTARWCQYTGCFTTLGHNCRRWFPRPLWWKKFI